MLEKASAGCSAKQEGPSVVISCPDGTQGILASAGSVLVFPRGGIGVVPIFEYNNGDIVVMDVNENVLGTAATDLFDNSNAFGIKLYIGELVFTGVIHNNRETEKVELLSYNNGYAHQASSVLFKSDDCSGPSWVYPSRLDFSLGIVNTGSKYYVIGENTVPETLLFKSRIIGGNINYNGRYSGFNICESGEFVLNAYLSAEYTPPSEILNAAYPVRLEQLP